MKPSRTRERAEGMPRQLTTIKRRLAKVERFLTDASGLVPHTQAWMDYWMRELKALIVSQSPAKAPVPLEVLREYIRTAPGDGAL